MSKSNALEEGFLDLIFFGATIPNIADDAGTSPLANLYVSLHTADPGEGGDQTTNEAAYTSYARVATTRGGSPADWVRTGSTINPVATIEFPEATGGTETITHFAVGSLSSGAGVLYYIGTVTPNIEVSNGVTPKLTTATAITED